MENTSYIFDISYEIEKLLYEGTDLELIQEVIIKLQGKGKFPKNLELIDAYLDKSFGSSGCALGEFTYYTGGSSELQVYKFEVISDIAQAFVNVTNGFLSKAKKAFKGTGLRSGKNDGIVNSISEVLEVEEKNVIEIEKKIISIAKMAQIALERINFKYRSISMCQMKSHVLFISIDFLWV